MGEPNTAGIPKVKIDCVVTGNLAEHLYKIVSHKQFNIFVMKRRLLKIGLPAMAFLTAGVMAFASAKEAPAKAALVTGNIWTGTVCQTNTKNCNEIGEVPCKTDLNQQVYRAGTMCVTQLFHRN